MSELGKLENPEESEKPEKVENPIKETSEDLIGCIKKQESEVPEKTEAFDSLIGCIEKFKNLTETSDVKTGLNELSNSLQEFKGQNEKLDKAIDGVTDKIKDVSEKMEKGEVTFKDIIDAICQILEALLPIILAIL